MKILLLGPTPRNSKIKNFLELRSHTVVITADQIDLNFAEENQIDLIISNGYGPILKNPLVARYKNRIINLHATFLPYGKGIGTTLFSVFEGTPTGVSIHFIDEKIDTGAILFRKSVTYNRTETLRSFYHRLLEELESLFFEKWPQIEGNKLTPTPQNEFGIKVHYRSRLDSERFMELLPQKWDTPLSEIEGLGLDFFFSEEFLTAACKRRLDAKY